jgi:hypothetical protein
MIQTTLSNTHRDRSLGRNQPHCYVGSVELALFDVTFSDPTQGLVRFINFATSTYDPPSIFYQNLYRVSYIN